MTLTDYYKIVTPWKDLYLGQTGDFLTSLEFQKNNNFFLKKTSSILVQEATKQLVSYLNGDLHSFNLPLSFLKGSSFQQEVWKEMAKVPYGQTISYGDLASKISRPKAYRAVGSATGKNPLPIIIPCHRVIQSDGTWGHYTGGAEIKNYLLKLEGVVSTY